MDKLSFAEFARALDLQRASVTMAIKNGKLIPDSEKKLINIKLPQNKIWIDNQIAKGKIFDLNRAFDKNIKTNKKSSIKKNTQIKQKTKLTIEETEADIYISKVQNLEYEKKLEDLRLKKIETRQRQLQVEKLEGTLIPVDAVKSVFLFAVEEFRNAYLQKVNQMASIYVERLGGTETDYKELQKELTQEINDSLRDTKSSLIKGVSNIIQDYQEVRSRGERK